MPASELHSTQKLAPRALVIAVQTPSQPDDDVATSLDELAQLLGGLGIHVEASVVQRRHDNRDLRVLGTGKLEEVQRLLGTFTAGEDDAEPTSDPDVSEKRAGSKESAPPERPWLVVFDGELSPGQQRALAQALDSEVVDRTQVILSVFERRARTRIAQIEIEMARLEYEAPRIRDQKGLMDQQAGGGGRGGKGHTGAELKKQELRRRLSTLKSELEQAQRSQQTRRQRRQQVERVALVGYTNAGKSSWMRLLTGGDIYVENALFATLDTTVRALSPTTSPRVVVADTVGFLRNLPNHLLASFRSTLDEALDADLLLVVVDVSDPQWQAQLEVTRQVLAEVGGESIPSVVLLNKADRLDPAALEAARNQTEGSVVVSAKDPAAPARVRQVIIDALDAQRELAELHVPYQAGAIFGSIHQGAHVLAERFDEQGTTFELRARAEFIAAWRKQIGCE